MNPDMRDINQKLQEEGLDHSVSDNEKTKAHLATLLENRGTKDLRSISIIQIIPYYQNYSVRMKKKDSMSCLVNLILSHRDVVFFGALLSQTHQTINEILSLKINSG